MELMAVHGWQAGNSCPGNSSSHHSGHVAWWVTGWTTPPALTRVTHSVMMGTATARL